jgi:putative DNA primase/helicase
MRENQNACRPPLSEVEVAGIAASVSRYAPGGSSSGVAEILRGAGVAELTKDSPAEERQAAAERLKVAAVPLDRVARALVRDELVGRHGFSAALADAILHQASTDASKQQGSAMLFRELEPWTEAVNGAELLGEIERTIAAYIVLPRYCGVAISLWLLHTHALDAAQISPRLAIVSPEKRCGKSTVLKLLGALARRPLEATNITAAVLFRTIEAHRPTLLVDEADTFLRDRDDLRGVLNAGHDRQSAKVPRCVGDDHEPRVFDVWAPVAFAGIGKQHDTLMDRAVVISMRRRSVGSEPVASFRRRQREALSALHRKIVRWTRDSLDALRNAEPQAPPGLDDRAVDNWEPLFALADRAGGAWPERARAAAVALSAAERGSETETHGEQLLADIRALFDEAQANSLPAKALLDHLVGMEERPWPEANRGRPLTARQLGTRLGRFNIKSRTVRDGVTTARSYVRADFEDAFSRYLAPPAATSGTRTEPSNIFANSEPSRLRLVTDPADGENGRDFNGVTDVTDGVAAEHAYAVLERAAIQEFGS